MAKASSNKSNGIRSGGSYRSSSLRFNRRELVYYQTNIRGKLGGVYDEEADVA